MNRIEPPDDFEIARAQKKDAKSIKSVLEKTSPYVLTLCKSWCRPPIESEDVAQETLITIARKLDSYQSRSSYFTWVYSVTYRTFLDTLRKETRRNKIAKMERFEGDLELIDAKKFAAQDSSLENSETIEMLNVALANIGQAHCEILILIDVKCETYGKVATELGIPIGTVRSRLARARIALRNELTIHGTNSQTRDVSIHKETK